MSVGVPIKILHEAEGHTVTLESINGELYRGRLIEAEDNMNVQLTDVTFTDKSDMLKNAPMLKRTAGTKGLGTGRGKTTMLLRGRGRGKLPAMSKGRGGR